MGADPAFLFNQNLQPLGEVGRGEVGHVDAVIQIAVDIPVNPFGFETVGDAECRHLRGKGGNGGMRACPGENGATGNDPLDFGGAQSIRKHLYGHWDVPRGRLAEPVQQAEVVVGGIGRKDVGDEQDWALEDSDGFDQPDTKTQPLIEVNGGGLPAAIERQHRTKIDANGSLR